MECKPKLENLWEFIFGCPEELFVTVLRPIRVNSIMKLSQSYRMIRLLCMPQKCRPTSRVCLCMWEEEDNLKVQEMETVLNTVSFFA